MSLDLKRIFAVEDLANYSKSVEICAQQNAILLPIKTQDELEVVCKKFPQIPDTSGGFTWPWRYGLRFYPNGTGVYADNSRYNPTTDDIWVRDYDCSRVGGDCEVATWCARGRVDKHPISWNKNLPFLCYNQTTNDLPSTKSTALTIAVVATFIVGLLFGLFYYFCKRRQRLSERYGSDELAVEYNAGHQPSRELPVTPETRQDRNNEDPYITPNQVNQQVLESMSGKLRNIYSEIDENLYDVRISVDPSQKQHDLEAQHHSDAVYSEIPDLPTTSSNDVVTGDVHAVGYATMKGNKYRAACSGVTSQRKVVVEKEERKVKSDDEYVEMKSFEKTKKCFNSKLSTVPQKNSAKKNEEYISVSELAQEE